MIGSKKRFEIFKRDNYACQICGKTATDGARLEVDHKLAVANGGTNQLENLWTLCFNCNRGKTNLYLDETRPIVPIKRIVDYSRIKPKGKIELPRLCGDLYNNFPLLIVASGKSLNQFAKEVDLSYTTVFDLYHSKSTMIHMTTLAKICSYFNITVGQLIIWLPSKRKSA